MSEFESYMDKLALHRQPETFAFRPVGTSGCEVVGPEGVIAWTTDGRWAAIIVAPAEQGRGTRPVFVGSVPMPDERNLPARR